MGFWRAGRVLKICFSNSLTLQKRNHAQRREGTYPSSHRKLNGWTGIRSHPFDQYSSYITLFTDKLPGVWHLPAFARASEFLQLLLWNCRNHVDIVEIIWTLSMSFQNWQGNHSTENTITQYLKLVFPSFVFPSSPPGRVQLQNSHISLNNYHNAAFAKWMFSKMRMEW